MGIDEGDDLANSSEITRPTAWSPMCFTVVQNSILFPQSSHIFAAFTESLDPAGSVEGGSGSEDAENTDDALRVSSSPPTNPTAMRIVNSLISLRRPILEAFSCDNDREAGTSIDVRIKPELAEAFELAACILGLSPPPPSNEPKTEEKGLLPPGPTNTTG
jgi:hypothetical protein